MNSDFRHFLKRPVLLLLFSILAFTAKASYTLTDEDVEMDSNGYIISCTYSFADKDIIIPETLDGITVKGIGDDYNNLFYNKDITSIQFPSGIEYIGRYGFAANQLVNVDIPSGLTSISERAFSSNQLASITIPGTITSIGEYAFAYNQFTSITIPDGVIEIGPSAFRSCKITDITLSNSVIFIREYAFYRNLFTTVTIPNSVCLIEKENFSYNTNFSGIILPAVAKTGFVDWIDGNGNHYAGGETATDPSTIYRANIPYTLTDADVEMDANGYIISCSYNFEASMITIPDILDGITVTGIGDDRNHLFYEKAITSIQLPSGLDHIGYSAFGYNLLSEVTIPSNVDSIEDHTFSYNLLSAVTIPNSVVFIGNSAFQVNKLTGVTLPENLSSIGNNAFRNNQLTGITIPDQVISIGSNAFNYNTLTEFTLPSSTVPGFIDWMDGNGNHYDAESTVSDLSTFYKVFIPYTLTDDDVEMDTNGYIISCSYSFEMTDIAIPDILDGYEVKGIGDGYSNLFYNKGITSVQLPSGMEYIGRNAFNNNLLTGINIPGTVTIIEAGAFSENQIKNLVIPEGVENIGASAFFNNRTVSVTLPNSLTSIGERAFMYDWLDSIAIPASLSRIEKNVFWGNHLKSVSIPDGVTYIGESAFGGNYLTDVELPNTLITIVHGAFSRNQLSSVTIPNNVTSISSSAFSDNQFSSFLLPTPNLPGFINWVDNDGNYFEGGEEVPVEKIDPTTFRARISYTLKDEDVEMDTNGYIISCSYNFQASLITIPETLDGIAVKGIADGESYVNPGSFSNKALVSVNFPSGLEHIGDYSFYSNWLSDIDFPDSVSYIGERAFTTNLLKSLVIPNKDIQLGEYAFSANRITEVYFPDGITSIPGGLLAYNGLTNVTIPNSVLNIGIQAFYLNNQLEGIKLPTPDQFGFYDWVDNYGNVYKAGDSISNENLIRGFTARFSYTLTDDDVEVDTNGYITSYSYSGLEKVIIIPDTLDGYELKGIVDGTSFAGVFFYRFIEIFVLPSGLEYIGDYAFQYNSLKSIVLPDNVISIGDHAFINNQLTGVVLPIPDISGFVDWLDINSGNEYEGGDTITDFNGKYEARFAYILTDDDVVVDANGYIISFNTGGTKSGGSYEGETSIAIPDTLDGYAVKGIADGTEGTGVFYNRALTTVILNSGMEYIGDFAFNSNSLTRINLPDNVVSIGEQAFANNQLLGIKLPAPNTMDFIGWIDTKSGIEYEGGDTITDFSGMYKAIFAYVLTDDDVEMDANGYIISCSYSFENKDIIIPDTLDSYVVRGIADGTENTGVFYNNAVESVFLPGSLEYVGAYSFNSNELTGITLPNSVVSIGKQAFAANQLTSFALPEPVITGFIDWTDSTGNHYEAGSEVTDLGTSYHATFLYTLTDEDVEMDSHGYIISCSYGFEVSVIAIPDTLDGYVVKGIADGTEDSGVFYNKVITSVSLPSGLNYIGAWAFGSNQLTSVTIPDSVYFIGSGAFTSNQLTSIAVPNSISFIGNEAFASNELTEFVLPASTVPGFVDWFDSYGNHYAGGATVTDLSTHYRAGFPYTLTDEDVEMDAEGYIISCSYGFEASIITIPETLDGYAVKGIGDDYTNLFYDKGITSIQLPSGLEYIGTYAFSSNLITGVTIPNSVRIIGDEAFSNNLLTGVIIPSSVNYIGSGTFLSNQLTSIVLPEAQKEGYVFDNWNGSIPANTEVMDLSIAYTADFTLVTDIENASGFNVRVYPNPTRGFVTIEVDDIFSVELMSLSGVLIKKLNAVGSTCTLDLSSQDSGIYLLRITGKNGTYVKSIVKD